MQALPPAASLDDIVVSGGLPDSAVSGAHAGEIQALLTLARTLAATPDEVSQRLAELALSLTGAESAGVSLEDVVDGEPVFRWVATAGEFSRYLHGTMPREFSPCGVVLSRGCSLLMRDPSRHFPYIEALHVPIRVALLSPFSAGGKLVGTVWALRHSEARDFTSADRHSMDTLAAFASAISDTVRAARNREEKLAGSESGRLLLTEYFRQSPDFVALLRGPDHVFELANEAYSKLVGRKWEDLAGRPVFEALPDVRNQGFEELLDGVYTRGQPYIGRGVSVQFEREDGTLDLRFIDISYQPIRAQDGAMLGIFAQGHDVTDQHVANEQLREADAGKNRFLAVLSHELRNPLGAISLAAHVLRHTEGKNDIRQQRAVQTLGNQAAVLTRLVDDLFDVSRVNSGKLHLKMDSVDLHDVVARAVESVQPMLAAKSHSFDVSVPKEPVHVHGDSARVGQIVSNLLANAAKYSPDGSRIVLAVERESRSAVIRVSDNGVGISEEFLPHLFELYSQANVGSEKSPGGLGLGLALVKQLVELHKGEVNATSAGLGKGATFTVKLPMVI